MTAPLFLQMDEEGYFHSSGVRWSDPEAGRTLLTNLSRNEFGAYQTFADSRSPQVALLEFFDAPLVAQSFEFIEKTSNAAREGFEAQITTPYGLSFSLLLNTLRLDEWDRIHGRTKSGLVFVLSRKAQAQLFSALDEYDDDSIAVNGVQIPLNPWPAAAAAELDPEYWSERHRKSPGWDLGGPHPSIEKILPQLKLSRCRVLVSGAGVGHDAAALAKAGHIVTAVDFSEEALQRGRAVYSGVTGLSWMQADLLQLPQKLHGQFDLVFEHTSYCAIDPALRNQLVKSWRMALTDRGQLLALLPLFDKDEGPPFGSSEWELRERFKKDFDFIYWSRSRFAPPSRLGQELILFAQKKNGAG